MRKDFTDVNIGVTTEQDVATGKVIWEAPELIPIKSFYTKKDLEEVSHLKYVAGLPPFIVMETDILSSGI